MKALSKGVACLALASAPPSALADGVASPWPTSSGGADAVAAAALSGWYATASTNDDQVEVRDIRGSVMRVITRSDIEARIPWMSLDPAGDGPDALAWSDSGRLLFIVVRDDQDAGDHSPSDAVLRYDSVRDQLALFARLEVSDDMSLESHGAALHFAGRLFVATDAGVEVFRAEHDDAFGTAVGTGSLNGESVRGLAVDRAHGVLYAVSPSGFYRGFATDAPDFQRVGNVANARAVTYSDHFGPDERHGAYVLTSAGASCSLLFVNDLQAQGVIEFEPTTYVSFESAGHDVCAAACGRMLVGVDGGAEIIADDEDPWLDFEHWLRDEFSQGVAFGRGLISPDGEPDGWVIDADVAEGGMRFHPATPDAAAWAVLLLIVNDRVAGDARAEADVRRVLERYAGLSADGIAPDRSADGIYRHWIDPVTGGVAAGWSDEFATMSTMEILLAAARATQAYPNDARIRHAAQLIMGGVHGWGSYIQPGTDAVFLEGRTEGGATPGTAASPFHEGILFVEQAAVYGSGGAAYEHWLDRSRLPSATYVTAMPVSTGAANVFQPAFVTLYPQLLQPGTRGSESWAQQARSLLASNAAWTDDHGPKFMTVFSAGTTRADWGGYHADSLSDHPGDVSTFPSLMAFASRGETAPAVAAYEAYRHGLRERFQGGASILFRRSNVDGSFTPPDAGLPDVAIGALGLAELLDPGTVDAALSVEYPSAIPCLCDIAPPFGSLDFFDIAAYLNAFAIHDAAADCAAPPGVFDFFDVMTFLASFSDGCP